MSTKEWFYHLPRLPWVNVGVFVFISLLFVATQVRGHALSSKAASTGPAKVRGDKVDYRGFPFIDPGAQISFNSFEFGPREALFEADVRAGFYNMWSSVPDGYEVWHSVCSNCYDHEESSYRYGRMVDVLAPDDGFVHIRWKYISVYAQ